MKDPVPLTRVLFVTVVLSLFILRPIARADWEKTFGGEAGDRAYSVRKTTDGGYVIAGYTYSFGAGQSDVYLVKMDDSGNLEWQSTFGGIYTDRGYSVFQTSDGGYIVTGYTSSFGTGGNDVYLVKTDDSGNLEWENTYGGTANDEGSSVQQTMDGGYIIAGSSGSFSNGNWDVYLIKTDDSGNLEWQNIFGGTYSEHGYSVGQTTDEGYIIAGYTISFGAADGDVYLVKTDDSGNLEWQNTYGGTDSDIGNSVQQTTDGGYVIAGETKSFGAGGTDVYLVKTDDDGNQEWQNTFGEKDKHDRGNAVQQTTDGGYIIAGETSIYYGYLWYNDDVYLVKANDLGEQQWTKKFSKTQGLIFVSREGASSVQQTADGDYIIAGDTAPFDDPHQDAYVIKTTGECPSTVVSSEPAVLENLREFRNGVLAQSEAGRSIIDDYYDHSPEIVRILRRHPALIMRSGAILRDVMPGIHYLLDSAKGRNIVMTRFLAARIEELFADISKEGGDELSVTLAGLNDRIDAGKGMRISEVKQLLLEK